MRNKRSNLKLIDDLARVATGALGSLGDVQAQVRRQVRERVEQIMERMDLVTREEFERVEALSEKARERQEELETRLFALEGKKKKPAVRKAPVKKNTKGKKK